MRVYTNQSDNNFYFSKPVAIGKSLVINVPLAGCGIFVSFGHIYYNYCLQPVYFPIIFCKIGSERRRDQLKQKKRVIWDLLKARGERAHIKLNFVKSFTGFTGCRIKAVEGVRPTPEKTRETGRKKNGVNKMRKNTYNMVWKSVGSNQTQHKTAITPPDPISGFRNKEAVNISKPEKVQAEHKVTNVETHDEEEILSCIIRLEVELGREINLFDLLVRFSHSELDKVHDSLKWLYPNLFSTPQLVVV